MNLNFWRSDFTYGVENDHNVESGFWQIMTFDVLFEVVIFVVVINSFRRCDNLLFDVLVFYLFDVLIALINLFDVVIVYNFFGVLFGFRRCEICSSDLFPAFCCVHLSITSILWKNLLTQINCKKMLE